MALTKHSHYLLLLVALVILNGPGQTFGRTVGGTAGEMVVAAAFGIGTITVIIMWIVFAASKKKRVPEKAE